MLFFRKGKFINIKSCIFFDYMGDELFNSKEEISRMFADEDAFLDSDEALAVHIMHRFNIDRETMETMPAFDEPLRPLLGFRKEE